VTSNQQPATSNQKPATSYQQPAVGNQQWYAIYTKSRNEKKVLQFLEEANIESYLPIVKTLKQWSDRKKWVEEPLFKSYIFVRVEARQYYNVLNVPGVVRYISFEGKAVIVPEKQILAIQQFLNKEQDRTLISDTFMVGDRIEIIRGALMGLQGNLVQVHGKQKVKIEIESVGQSVILTIPKSQLKVIANKPSA
jgi:transcription antitermination factor NusG